MLGVHRPRRQILGWHWLIPLRRRSYFRGAVLLCASSHTLGIITGSRRDVRGRNEQDGDPAVHRLRPSTTHAVRVGVVVKRRPLEAPRCAAGNRTNGGTPPRCHMGCRSCGELAMARSTSEIAARCQQVRLLAAVALSGTARDSVRRYPLGGCFRCSSGAVRRLRW
jgi:hypothetical protein